MPEASSPSLLVRWLSLMQRAALLVVLAAAAVTGLALHYAAGHLGVNNNTIDMLDESLPFRLEYDRLGREFPGLLDTMLVVIEAPTPEQARAGARAVTDALADRDDLVAWVSWPAGEPHFRANGLLYRDEAQLATLADRLSGAQPLLVRLAEAPTAVTFLDLLSEAEQRRGEVDFDASRLQAALTTTIDAALAGETKRLSWQRLLGGAGDDGTARETLVVMPRLVENKVNAGKPTLNGLKALRAELGLDHGPVRMAVTGTTALKSEELSAVLSGAKLTGMAALALVTLIMVVGLRSFRFIVVALAALLVGLAISAAFAAAAIGRVNLISVAFVVLYVGLGVNYAVHYLLRVREQRAHGAEGQDAVRDSGVALAGALALSTVTTALGFFAFTPTSFRGIAELGLIAGFAMFVTFAVSYTVIPALLTLIGVPKVRPFAERSAAPWQVALLELPLTRRKTVLTITAVIGVIACVLAPRVAFDTDPLNLRDPASESVRTMRALIDAKDTGYRNIQLLVDPETPLEPLLAELEALPEVERTASVRDLVPTEADQEARLALIDEMNFLLGPTLSAEAFTPQDVDTGALAAATERLRAALAAGGTASRPEAEALAAALTTLEAGLAGGDADALAARVNEALLGLLPATMGQLLDALAVTEPFGLADLPASARRLVLNDAGIRLVQIYPAGDVDTLAGQARFMRAVEAIAPTATGAPIIQEAAGRAIVEAFIAAIGWALAGITLLLLVMLRSFGDTLRVLAPLLLGGAATLAFMVLAGIDFNFANVVALPLLLGVGVDNGIHIVYRHRHGDALPGGNVLRTATASAIVLGALVTAGGFGNLALSPHAGTASMGVILAVGLALTVFATLVVLPALLGRRGPDA